MKQTAADFELEVLRFRPDYVPKKGYAIAGWTPDPVRRPTEVHMLFHLRYWTTFCFRLKSLRALDWVIATLFAYRKEVFPDAPAELTAGPFEKKTL